MSSIEEIKYSLVRTGSITDQEMRDFLYVFNHVFKANNSISWFKWKYLDNIYGESVIVIGYHNSKPIGIRAFWRNDIQNVKCYQPCDTALLEKYRGKGIFSEMSRLALKNTEGAYIYNFPNENSVHGNVKMGWKKHDTWYLSFSPLKSLLNREDQYVEDEYLKWRFIDKPDSEYGYTKHNGEIFLIYRRNKNLHYVLGRISGKFIDQIKYYPRGLYFIYRKKKPLIYYILKSKSTIYTRNNSKYDFEIPMNKADFF